MRTPLRQKGSAPRGRVAGSISFPAPIGGWNARDAWAAMEPTDAIALENWVPRTSYLESRGGFASHATGMTGNGKTLATYNAISGTNALYCYTASGIYDVTSAGAVGASKLARTNGKHQWVMFGDGTSNWLIAVNGVDKPAYFDGTTWTAVDGVTTPALTGLTTTKIIGVNAYQGRLFFIEKDTLSFWYLASGAAGGALTEFPLDGECVMGGYLMAMATWTVDAGDGIDDRAVFITSEGEVLVYAGTNPSSAAAWQKVGRYFIGKPLGRRCFCQYGGDVVLLTQNGAFPLSAALQSATIDNKLALSFKVENAFNEAARTYGTTFGWKPIIHQAQSALIVNVPIAEDGTHQQYVMNTITKSWTKFTGWDAEDFGLLNSTLYFCDGTVVYKAWTGVSDNNADIVLYGRTAFSYYGSRGVIKRVTGYRPVFSSNGPFSYLTGMDVDFSDETLIGSASATGFSAGLWGTAIWGTSVWGSGNVVSKDWTSPAVAPGMAFAAKIRIATKTVAVQWMSGDFAYETGGVMG